MVTSHYFHKQTLLRAQENGWYHPRGEPVVDAWTQTDDEVIELGYNTDKETIVNVKGYKMFHVPKETWNHMICLEIVRLGEYKLRYTYMEAFKSFLDRYYDLAYANKRPRVPYTTYRAFKKFSQESLGAKFYYTNKTDTTLIIFSEDFRVKYDNFEVPKEFLVDMVEVCSISIETLDNIKGPFFSYEKNIIDTIDKIQNKKENKIIMKAPVINFEFGPIDDNTVVMSPCGLAIAKGDGSYVAYNAATGKVVDVTGFTFDFGKVVYKIPVAVKDIKVGDLIYHNKKPVYVVNTTNGITAIDYAASEQKTIVPVSNLFGFDYVTKVMTLFNFNATTPDPSNPFGNIMPMIFMSSILNDDGDGIFDGDMGKMMMMSMLMGGQNPFTNMFAAPVGNAGNTDPNAPPQFTIPGFNMGN